MKTQRSIVLNPVWTSLLTVSLYGAQAVAADTSSQKAAAFGLVNEQVLKSQEVTRDNRTTELFDLDTSCRASSTTFGANDRETHAWIRSNRLDVLGIVEKGQIAVLCMDVVVIPTATNNWDKITAQSVTTNWSLAQGEPNKITAISPLADKTDTFLFRTREGGQGVLQILGQSSHPLGVKIRYKLVLSETK